MPNKPYIKHFRKFVKKLPDVSAFMFSHYFTENNSWDQKTNKFTPNGDFNIDLSITFLWLAGNVRLHTNSDEMVKSYNAYVEKLSSINKMVKEAKEHILTGKGPFLTRDFLSSEKVNDGFSSSLYIHVDPDLPDNYCIFEVASCFKKYRHTGNVKEILHYLTVLLDFLELVDKDLEIIKTSMDKYIKSKEVIENAK